MRSSCGSKPGWPTSSNVSVGWEFGFEIQQQPQRFPRARVVEQMGLVDRHDRVLILLSVQHQELLDSPNRVVDTA